MSDPTNHLIVLMIVIPMAMGLLCVPLINRIRLCRGIGVVSFSATFIIGLVLMFDLAGRDGVLVSQMGDWAAPYGISLVYDWLSGLMLTTASLVALAALIHSFGSLSDRTERRYFHPLLNFMMFGVNLSFLTGDLFNLFVSFEIMLMASYGLLVIGGGKAQLRQAYKYILMNLLASTVFVIAAGMAYGMLGTLNMADLSRVTSELAARDELPTGFVALGVLFLFVFALKAGVFPLWFWLPDTYPTLPIAIVGLFGGVLTKVGTYAIARTFPLIFMAGDSGAVLQPILASGAGLTMLIAVFGAIGYTGMRRVFCLLLIVGVGYALFGIAIGSAASLGGSAFYMAQSMLVMCLLFLCCGLVEREAGTDESTQLGEWLKGRAWLGVMMFIGLMSIVGLPPTSGFYGKLVIIREGLNAQHWLIGVTALLVGGLTLLAALRVWGNVFWGPRIAEPSDTVVPDKPGRKSGYFAAALLTVASLVMGFVGQPFYYAADEAGSILAEPTAYLDAVLNPPTPELPDASPHDGDDHHEDAPPSDPHQDEAEPHATPSLQHASAMGGLAR